MNKRRPYARRLRDTRCFSGTSLFFAVLASLACAAIIPALGGGRPATIAGAVLSPVAQVMFLPTAPGPREAVLVPHVKPGNGEHRITITGTASALRPAT